MANISLFWRVILPERGHPRHSPRACFSGSRAGVVNLKFLSLGWHARGRNFKFENHTRNIDLPVQLVNPKFALRAAPRCCEFRIRCAGGAIPRGARHAEQRFGASSRENRQASPGVKCANSHVVSNSRALSPHGSGRSRISVEAGGRGEARGRATSPRLAGRGIVPRTRVNRMPTEGMG